MEKKTNELAPEQAARVKNVVINATILVATTNGDLDTLFNTITEIYITGVVDGLREYAWWKDGVQYVGTCGTTLREAIAKWVVERTDENEHQSEPGRSGPGV